MTEEEQYYPPTQQPQQHKILIYEANGLIGHRLLEYFRNDHLIETNPNVMMGTLSPRTRHSNALDLDLVIQDNPQLLDSVIAASDIILFPLNRHNTKQLEHLLKFLKCMKADRPKKVILIGSLFTWRPRGRPHTIKGQDYATRIPIDSSHKQLEDLCLGISTFNQLITGCVISCGVVYGMGEEELFGQFKQALEQKEPLKIYGKGANQIPTIHVDDLAQLAFDTAFSDRKGFQFGVDHSRNTQKELLEGISLAIGNGQVTESLIEDGFLEADYDIWAADIRVDPQCLPALQVWKCKEGLVAGMGSVVGEFNLARGLKPNKIFIHGTPASGKSRLAEILSKNYGLVVLTIKELIEDVKKEESEFAKDIKASLEELKAAKIEQERKAHEEMKKKKKGKGVEEFDPEKVVPRLEDKDVCRIVKRRIGMTDCLNKGYIIDGVIKSYAQCEAVFTDDQGELNTTLLPNSVFNVEASEEETRQRIKNLPAESTAGTHWNEEHTSRRFIAFKQRNEPHKWADFFNGKVDIKHVPFNYTDSTEFIQFVQRNGPLGFKAKAAEEEKQEVQEEDKAEEKVKEAKEEEGEEAEQEDPEEEVFDLQKLTQSETKILNEKSRPIRQYLIDNVIPQITEGLLQICKETPPDPIKYLIAFLQNRKSRKRRLPK